MFKKEFLKKYGTEMICWISVFVISFYDVIVHHYGWIWLFITLYKMVSLYRKSKVIGEQNDNDEIQNKVMWKYGAFVLWGFALVIWLLDVTNQNTGTLSSRVFVVGALINMGVIYYDLKTQ